jgi:hypothetical protein
VTETTTTNGGTTMKTTTTQATETQKTTDTLISIEQIYDLCRERGCDVGRFWNWACGGDRAAMPREDVERCMAELEDQD